MHNERTYNSCRSSPPNIKKNKLIAYNTYKMQLARLFWSHLALSWARLTCPHWPANAPLHPGTAISRPLQPPTPPHGTQKNSFKHMLWTGHRGQKQDCTKRT